MDFRENLKKIRKEKQLSQQQLADKLEVAQSTVGMWESGRRTPKLYELDRLAKILNITVTRLIGKHDRDLQIMKNAIYVDGKKIDDLDPVDIKKILEQIEALKSSKSKNALAEAPAKAPSATKKILIIDDEQEMCEMLYTFLVPHNYKVFLTFNGQMGLEYFEEIKPDVVLLDLTLPDIDGVEVLKILRKISDVPVIVVTAHPENIADIHLQDLRIEGYIEKPFSLEQVLNTLKHIIGE
jgi:CheY-like chemotaxis protein/DNA-binding XRE family transcriptional regulator